jgi:cytochrome c biogenesis protein CcdA/glutaredoxin
MLSSAFAQNQVDVYFFWGNGCGHCAAEKIFLQGLIEDYPEINLKSYEVWHNSTNKDYFLQKTSEMGISSRGVPVTIIGGKHWIGYEESKNPLIIEQVEKCINEGGCSDNIINETLDIINETLCIHAFLTEDCRQCSIANETFTALKEKYNINIEFHDYPNEKELYNRFKEIYGISSAGFPIVFLGDYYLAGDSAIQANLESLVINCINASCICPIQNIEAYTSNIPPSDSIVSEEDFILNLPFIGEIDLSGISLYLVTIIIALMDGFNPCSLWMIMFLIGIVLYTGSRKKILLIGLSFLITTTLIYGVFMAGLLNVFKYVGFIFWIRLVIGLIALIFAAINIKDYFWYKKGISLTIPDKAKPGLFKKIRNIMNPQNSLLATIGGTIVLALSVTLVELPCTAGLPMLWTAMLAKNSIQGIEFIIHLAIYLGLFMIDEAAIVFAAVITLKMTKFEEKHGRILKLFGGLFMLFLGMAMIFSPDIMDDFFSMLKMFLATIIMTGIINYLFNHFRTEKKEVLEKKPKKINKKRRGKK